MRTLHLRNVPDDVMDRLHAGGIRVDLATATASPPPWLTRSYPEILPVLADGTTLWQGGRQAYCPSSPVFAEHSLRLCRAMAGRYADHDALALWHVSNELGCHNALCYCDVSAEAFRRWLTDKYGDIDTLNHAWGTAFWSQHYASFDEILPPRAAPTRHRRPQGGRGRGGRLRRRWRTCWARASSLRGRCCKWTGG